MCKHVAGLGGVLNSNFEVFGFEDGLPCGVLFRSGVGFVELGNVVYEFVIYISYRVVSAKLSQCG